MYDLDLFLLFFFLFLPTLIFVFGLAQPYCPY